MVESAVKPSRKNRRHAKRSGKEASKGKVNLKSDEMIETSESVRSFRDKVKPYRPVDLFLAGEKKRKRAETKIDPALPPALVDTNSGLARREMSQL
jgi:hypothetical protein